MTVSGEITKVEEKLTAPVVALQTRFAAIQTITTTEQHREMAAIKLDAKGYIANVGFELDPGISKAKEVVRHLEEQKAKYVDPAKAILKGAEEKIADANRRERLAREADEKRRNEELRIEAERKAAELRREAEQKAAEERRQREAQAEADRKERERQAEIARKEEEKRIAEAQKEGMKQREAEKLRKEAEQRAADEKKRAEEAAAIAKKQAEEDEARRKRQAEEEAAALQADVETVKVQSNRPIIAGIKGGGSWKFRITDITKIPRALLYPNPNEEGEFDPEKFPRIGTLVRNTKDKEKAEAQCPGIEVYYKDR
jgi:DNA repair exonuclease SbcCD ATPase subunit